ncbi:MAG: HlyD family efflux transporter periplasmic adaptor subunit [Pseudomonadota bacterium]
MKNLVLIFIIFILSGSLFAQETLWEVKKGDIVEKKVFQGEVQASNKVDINCPQISWRLGGGLTIEEIIEDGKIVKKGDVVLKFERSVIESKLNNTSEEYNLALVDLKREETRLKLEKIEIESNIEQKKKELEKANLGVVEGGIMSQISREKAKLDVEAKTMDLKLSKERLEKFEEKYVNSIKAKQIVLNQKKIDVKEIEDLMNKLEVLAPVDGVIYKPLTELNWQKTRAETGKLARSGDLIMQIPDLNTLEVHVFAHPSDSQDIKIEDLSESSFAAFPNLIIKGKVTTKSDYVSTLGERTGITGYESKLSELKIIVSLEGKKHKLRPGFTTKTEITSIIAKDVLYVPIIALEEDKEKKYVIFRSGEKKEVKVGKTSFSFAEILSGLKVGDKIKMD